MKLFDRDNWQEIWATISRNKTRSVLTGFGVFWGIFMLVILVGVGNSFRGGVEQQVQGIAPNSCFFQPNRTSLPYAGYQIGRRWAMNSKDVENIRRNAKSVEYVSPMLFAASGDKNVVRGMKSGSYGVRGIMPEHFNIELPKVLYGRLFNELDEEQRRKVCIIGKEVYETLFAIGEDPVGQYIRVNGIYYQVAGVIAPISSGMSIGGRMESSVFTPFSTMRQTSSRGDEIYFMMCTAQKGYRASQVIEEVSAMLKSAHSIAPNDDKAMWCFDMEAQFMRFIKLFAGIDVLIWIVGLGALFSGIIGISNIMLVTVRERMREIGVRRALGATPMQILGQILSESFVLTAAAGMMGLIFGILILAGVSNVMEQMPSEGSDGAPFLPPIISFGTAMLSLAILVVSGLAAGILPATKALKIKAIDAIRDE